MERLTERSKIGTAFFNDDGALIRGAGGAFRQKKDMTANFIHQRFVALDKAIDRLAAYEDTGLEPEEIGGLKTAIEELRKKVDRILDSQKFVQILKERGIDVDAGIRHMKDIIQAEEGRRMVVLQEGVTVHHLQEEYWKAKHMADEQLPSPSYTTGCIAGFGAGVIHILDKILTREEVEAALKKMEEDA